MQSVCSIITPADDISLCNIDDAKLAMNISSSTNMATDDQIKLFIEWASAEVAAYCNRIFARETLVETVLENDANRIFLSHYPIQEINSINENDTALLESDYYIDQRSGCLTRVGGSWVTPVVVDYIGGYHLPYESPIALRQACLLLTREAYQASQRGDATVRMVSHKDSRVIYFDPNQQARSAAGGGGTAGSPARRAVQDLLHHFMHFYI
jgi:hypothetical protein